VLQYVGEEDPLSLITDFLSGYAKHGQLSKPEMEILPDLINLRIFSNVIYFTGR
jgi:Ser/Thr protein kinase RdoA (MazF antagonist)